jgi:hypothetical protein
MCVLPSQFHTRRNNGQFEGERRLFAAVLQDAIIRTLPRILSFSGRQFPLARRRRLSRRARRTARFSALGYVPAKSSRTGLRNMASYASTVSREGFRVRRS